MCTSNDEECSNFLKASSERFSILYLSQVTGQLLYGIDAIEVIHKEMKDM